MCVILKAPRRAVIIVCCCKKVIFILIVTLAWKIIIPFLSVCCNWYHIVHELVVEVIVPRERSSKQCFAASERGITFFFFTLKSINSYW